MKKMLAVVLVLALSLTLVACDPAVPENTEPSAGDTTKPALPGPESALQVLENIWALYGEADKFAVVGGNPEDMYMDGPGAWDMANAANLPYSLLIPEDRMASIDEAATMVHMMNANTFTCGVVHLARGVDTADFAAAMRDAIQSNPWMCGFPERMVIAAPGEGYVLIAFGVGSTMTPFCEKLQTAYAGVQLLYDEAIG